jgi:monooxygenase
VQRSIQQFPRQGIEGPWQISNDHRTNVKTFRHSPVADENLRFGSTRGSSRTGVVAAEISA